MKLIRDKVPEIAKEEHNTSLNTKTADPKDFTHLLGMKLLETSAEVYADFLLGKSTLTENMADIQQIIEDICQSSGIDITQVEHTRVKKKEHLGGFLLRQVQLT